MKADISLDRDIQDRMPDVRVSIDRVGVKGLIIPLSFQQLGGASQLATVDLTVELVPERRGLHMSRLVEAVNEVALENGAKSLEELGALMLKRLAELYNFTKGEVNIATVLLLNKPTPVSNKQSLEGYEVGTRIIADNGDMRKLLTVKVVGNTLCPHSLEQADGIAHAQRAHIELALLTDIKEDITFVDLIKMAELSFSSPTYGLLKTEDEVNLVRNMYTNPKFVEDVARDCYQNLRDFGAKGTAHIKVTADESIHKHSAIAELERELE